MPDDPLGRCTAAVPGQVTPTSTVDDTANIDWDRIHTLTGPANWGWMENHPDFGFPTGEFNTRVLQTFALDTVKNEVEFAPCIRIPMKTPMRIVYEISVIKGGRSIAEPQYKTADYYATTGFATTIDEAAKKATRYMIEYLTATKGLNRFARRYPDALAPRAAARNITAAAYATTTTTSQRSQASGIDFTMNAATSTAGMPPSAMPPAIRRSISPSAR